MKYYITPIELAKKVGVEGYRHKSEEYCICNAGDFAAYGLEKAIEEGAKAVTAKEAKEFINKGLKI